MHPSHQAQSHDNRILHGQPVIRQLTPGSYMAVLMAALAEIFDCPGRIKFISLSLMC